MRDLRCSPRMRSGRNCAASIPCRATGCSTVMSGGAVNAADIVEPSGSVDKGKLEQRGERVVVTMAHPVSTTSFDWSLQF
ncbi:hypothetical protein [Edaphobacter aggregans]|uniref:hypothetical protein n=1 Tax=Edaphobacter aggregans TaxID=570835 RepID=UPI001FDFD350|nr:hypothetical protein [Edaphobacter aggregans]